MRQSRALDQSKWANPLLPEQVVLTVGPLSAAVLHYKPEKDTCIPIDPNAIYLCDSGAQYLDGTTDTTRTVHLGTPTETEVEVYTRVLKALIGLHKAIFPKGTFGLGIDAFARQHLWVC